MQRFLQLIMAMFVSELWRKPLIWPQNLQNLTCHFVWNVLSKSVLLSFCQVVKQSFKVKYSLNLRSAKAFTTHYGNVGLRTLKRNHSFYPLMPFTKPMCALFYLAYWVCNTYLLCLTYVHGNILYACNFGTAQNCNQWCVYHIQSINT